MYDVLFIKKKKLNCYLYKKKGEDLSVYGKQRCIFE